MRALELASCLNECVSSSATLANYLYRYQNRYNTVRPLPHSTMAVNYDGDRDGGGGVLVVFDFDWSLVEANSDRFLLRTLCPALLRKLKAWRGTMPWTQLLTELLDELMAQTSDVTRELIERTVADIPVQDRMIDALLLAANHPDSVVVVVSQANTVFIECMLARHELLPLVGKVVANPAAWTTDSMQRQRLIIQPFHPADQAPHGCRLCPVNMCKGVVLDQLRREHKPQRIVYVGDGSVDFCPVLRLSE